MKFEVKDNLTEYVDYLQKAVETNEEQIVSNAGKTLIYLITSQGEIWGHDEYGSYGLLLKGDAPYYSGALLTSALRKEQQELSSKDWQSILTVYWTGMFATYSWSEFRSDKDKTKPPERDYAVYQETGMDVKAKYSDARHKHFFRNMVQDTAVKQRIYDDVALEYMKLLFKGNLK